MLDLAPLPVFSFFEDLMRKTTPTVSAEPQQMHHGHGVSFLSRPTSKTQPMPPPPQNVIALGESCCPCPDHWDSSTSDEDGAATSNHCCRNKDDDEPDAATRSRQPPQGQQAGSRRADEAADAWTRTTWPLPLGGGQLGRRRRDEDTQASATTGRTPYLLRRRCVFRVRAKDSTSVTTTPAQQRRRHHRVKDVD